MPKVLIYTNFVSARLLYVLDWIFGLQLQTSYVWTQKETDFMAYDGPKVNYTAQKLEGAINIRPETLLERSDVVVVTPTFHRWKHTAILFYNQPGAKVPFDIFAAVFYCISRYEEYLPASKDKHQRFAAQQSIASTYSFLQEPVVDLWLMHFKALLSKQFGITFPAREFTFLPTYDIDIAYAYRYKSAMSIILGGVKNALKLQFKSLKQRISTKWGGAQDPYDSFARMDDLHKTLNLNPIYFMLLAQQNASFDKNVLPQTPAMQVLLKDLSAKYSLGIHPSYQSNSQPQLLQQEWQILKQFQPQSTISRQHYIKLHLPETYRKLLALGITDDYSMGYPDANGFRAGTSNAFPWFDVLEDSTTSLTVHPFVYMDATSLFYDKAKYNQAYMEFERLYIAIRKVNGTMIPIFHNYTLGNDPAFKGWAEVYQQMMRLGAR